MRNFYISLSIWLLIIPILGIPGIWKNRLVTFTGLVVLAYSVWPTIIKKISVKPRIKKEAEEEKEQPMTFSDKEDNKGEEAGS